MAMIADVAGVSKNTVSLALRGDTRIPAVTRKRIQALAEEMGYRKNPVVAQLMSELRRSRKTGFQRTLALLNGHRNPDAFSTHPTIRAWVAGCERRGHSQGFTFDRFWLHDPELNGVRLARILHARGIDGAIVLGAFLDSRLPERFGALWEKIACVVAGVRTHQPTLSFCCVDHHALVMEAVRQVCLLGYRRPALVLSEVVDRLVEGRFSAGMWVSQQALPASDRIPSFALVGTDERFPEFRLWYQRYRPDILLTLHRHEIVRLVGRLGLEVPRDIGLVDLEHNPEQADWAAMEQGNDLSGETAVDMLIGMLHNHEVGVPRFPRATLGSSYWVPGRTAVPQGEPASRAKRPRAVKS